MFTAGIGLVVLFASGIVIALDGVVHVAEPVVVAALIVAVLAALTVVGAVWARSRRRGLGLLRSVGRSARALGRFIVDFF